MPNLAVAALRHDVAAKADNEGEAQTHATTISVVAPTTYGTQCANSDNMLKHGTAYVDRGQRYYERRHQQRVLSNLSCRAQELGYMAVKASASGPLSA